MGKIVSAIRWTKKRNSQGFTIVELLTAIGILGVLSGVVTYMMLTSSKSYGNLSVEAQLQSEAQLVANMITELAIDSSNALDTMPEGITGMGTVGSSDGVLVLDSNVNGVKKQYIVQLDMSGRELYLYERSYNDGSSSWGATTSPALLGNYITEFKVDTSRVEDENVLRFSLGYNKSGRSYVGNYQVLMRNRAYADKEREEVTGSPDVRMSIGIVPETVYFDVKNNDITGYHLDSIATAIPTSDAGFEFKATVTSNQTGIDKTVDWALKNADKDIFSINDEEPADTNVLKWSTLEKNFEKSPMDSFAIQISKEKPGGGAKVTRSAQVHLRRIKSLSLNAVSGVTGWNNQYSELMNGVSSTEARGYAYTGNNGKYVDIYLNASIVASNIAYGGGLDWKIYVKGSSGDWEECPATFASLKFAETPTGTSNIVSLGEGIANGQLFKVEVISQFDDSYKADYIFGVAPASQYDDDGFNSRGFYTNMSSYYDGFKGENGERPEVSKIVYLKCTKVDGAGNEATSADKVKVFRDEAGNWRLYVDFDAFSYSGDQKKSFYSGSVTIHLTYGYIGTDGKYYINGGKAANLISDMAAVVGISSSDITKVADEDIKYYLNAVKVSKINPAQQLLVIEKGKNKNVYVQTAFYNILSPRRGTYYFGTYIENMKDNLLMNGKGDSNAYFSVRFLTEYGDADKYVDNAGVEIKAKAYSSQRKYLTDPVKIRLTADDYYSINPSSADGGSYTEYEVLLANVEGMNCYIPGPAATYVIKDEENEEVFSDWPSEANDGTKTTVYGLTTDGTTISAKVYKATDGKCYCEYSGKTYTYNTTYNYWQK